eukprot:SAG31_NODE_31638_length_366_cov_0.520599_1_plen_87_part_10
MCSDRAVIGCSVVNDLVLVPSDLKGSWIDRNAAKSRPGSVARCRLCNQKFIVPDEGGPASGNSVCPAAANKQHRPSATFKDQDLIEK